MLYGKVKASERGVMARSLLAQVGLVDRAHHMPNELSDGQKKGVH